MNEIIISVVLLILGFIGGSIFAKKYRKPIELDTRKEKENYERELDKKSIDDILDMLDNSESVQSIKSESDKQFDRIRDKYMHDRD